MAPAHRHTQSALRFIVEGAGAYTAVDGERTTMAPGDFIITPSWTWHDHGNDGGEPVVWLDGLDIPIVALHDAQFAERHPKPLRRSRGRKAMPMRAGVEHGAVRARQRCADVARVQLSVREKPRRARKLHANGVCDPAHGVRMRYVNPVTGGWAMPTLGTFLQMLPGGFRGLPHRSTDGTVYCCVEGQGTVRIGDEVFEWGPRDIFVAPSWQTRTLSATTERCSVRLFGPAGAGSARPVARGNAWHVAPH